VVYPFESYRHSFTLDNAGFSVLQIGTVTREAKRVIGGESSSPGHKQ
jgi:hypothetical protein